MVGTGRFELPACRLGGGRSIQLSYVPTPALILPAPQTFFANICTVVHAIEVNVRD